MEINQSQTQNRQQFPEPIVSNENNIAAATTPLLPPHPNEQHIAIEFEFFHNFPKHDVIKEFASYNFSTKTFKNDFIRTDKIFENYDFFFNQQNEFLINFGHYIPYNYGSTRFYKIVRLLNQPNSVFYIKGERKQQLVQSFSQNKILNIEDFGCPPINFLPEKEIHFCNFHFQFPTESCALRKLHKTVDWLNNE
jgi:hypothetical protein